MSYLVFFELLLMLCKQAGDFPVEQIPNITHVPG